MKTILMMKIIKKISDCLFFYTKNVGPCDEVGRLLIVVSV